MQKTLLHNQSFLDFTIHHCGTLNNIVQMAVENNIGITDLLAPGSVLSVPEAVYKDKQIVEFYQNKKLIPAFGYITTIIQPDGIGSMIIENNFIVA